MRLSSLAVSVLLISGAYAHSDYESPEISESTVQLVKTTQELVEKERGRPIAQLEVPQAKEGALEQPSSWPKLIASNGYELGKATANLGWSATKVGAKAALSVAAAFAEWGIRTTVAYNVAHCNVEILETIVIRGGGVLTSLALGPAAGAGAEAAIGTGLKVSRFLVPGFDALLASAATPVVKPATDFIINNGPAALKATGQAAWSFGQSAASYFWGKAQTIALASS